jgi:hypothetical protein
VTTDLLDRVRAADIATDRDERPAFDAVLARIAADAAGERPTGGPVVRRPRPGRMIPVGVLATGALTAGLVVVLGTSDDGTLPRIGVLRAAADTAAADPAAGRFSGYVRDEETRLDVGSSPPGPVIRTRTTVRRASATAYDGSIDQVALNRPRRTTPRRSVTPAKGDRPRVARTVRGGRIQVRTTWRRPYGTIFSGALLPGERPTETPTDPTEARRAVASWATRTAPAGGDPAQAKHLKDAYGTDDGTQLALGYATEVLTAPRVAPGVRSAVFDALADVPGVRVDAHATDPAGRPAAALSSVSRRGPSVARYVLYIDPGTARVLGSRDRYAPTDPARGRRVAGRPYVSTSERTTVVHYTD